MHKPTKASCIEKIYKVPEDMTAFVKEVENFIQAEYFDDGIEVRNSKTYTSLDWHILLLEQAESVEAGRETACPCS